MTNNLLRFVRGILVAALIGVLAFAAVRPAYAETQPELHEAQAACLMDAQGNVLFAHNADAELPMASTTKVMTAIVALDSGLDLDQVITLHACNLDPSSQLAGFKEGDHISLRELLQVMLVYSANDAAENVAFAVAGSEENFVALMNAKAQELGLSHTHFENPHGLEEAGHYSSAADLCLMGRYALENYDFIAQTVQLREVEVLVGAARKRFKNTDALLESYPWTRGIKTGKTESGASFMGAAEREGIRIYSAVLCCATSAGRFSDTQTLWDWAYNSYYRKTLAPNYLNLRTIAASCDFARKLRVNFATPAEGLVDPAASALVEELTYTPRSMCMPGEQVGLAIWRQGSRVVALVPLIARLEMGRGTQGYQPPLPFEPAALEPLHLSSASKGGL